MEQFEFPLQVSLFPLIHVKKTVNDRIAAYDKQRKQSVTVVWRLRL